MELPSWMKQTGYHIEDDTYVIEVEINTRHPTFIWWVIKTSFQTFKWWKPSFYPVLIYSIWLCISKQLNPPLEEIGDE